MMDDMQKTQYSSCYNENSGENLNDWEKNKLGMSAVFATLSGLKM